jgi:hypothetical protein
VIALALVCALNVRAAQPVLVELFTSEGCSSCPPADALLQQLERSPMIPGLTVIAMSEHVDYWNHLGWRDPYSSAQLTARQEAYAARLRAQGAYTPEMVVDGAEEFVGSDGRRAMRAIALAAGRPKLDMKADLAGDLHVTIGPPVATADVLLAIVYDPDPSAVARGENAGRRLTHVSVVKSLQRVAEAQKNKPSDLHLAVSPDPKLPNQRAVVFVQERGQGRILGAAEVVIRPNDGLATTYAPESPEAKSRHNAGIVARWSPQK